MLTKIPKETEAKVNQQGKTLQWIPRPVALQQQVDQAYAKISSNDFSRWGTNGQENYSIAGIDDTVLLEKMFYQQIKKGQTKFILMEIGAGNFQWGRKLARWVNNHPSFKDQIEVSIYSLSGERNSFKSVDKVGVCTLYEYGNFKVENLLEEFDKRGQSLKNKVDFIGSWWCFRHLVDPAGTLLQAYELLREESGLIFVDGFSVKNTERFFKDTRHNQLDFFASFNAPFYIEHRELSRQRNTFIMQKAKNNRQEPLTDTDKKYNSNLSLGGSAQATLYNYVGLVQYQWSDLKKHEVRGQNYFTSSKQSELFLHKMLLDNSDKSSTMINKILADFKEVKSTGAKNDVDDICEQLRLLIKSDQKQALNCVNRMLSLDEHKALSVLNHKMEIFSSLLHVAKIYGLTSNNGSKLFEKLVGIATADILNLKDNYGGKTLLMDTARCSDHKTVEQLLAGAKVDITRVKSEDGHTSLSYAEEIVFDALRSYAFSSKRSKILFNYMSDERKQEHLAKRKLKIEEIMQTVTLLKAGTNMQHQADLSKKPLPAYAYHRRRADSVSLGVNLNVAEVVATPTELLKRSRSF